MTVNSVTAFVAKLMRHALVNAGRDTRYFLLRNVQTGCATHPVLSGGGKAAGT